MTRPTNITEVIILSLVFLIFFCSHANSDSKNKSNDGKAHIDLRRKNYNRKRFGRITLSNSTSDRIVRQEETSDENLSADVHKRKKAGLPPLISQTVLQEEYNNKKCWMNINAKNHFETMDRLDDRFASVRKKYEEAVENEDFDTQMLNMMLKTKGAAQRAVHSVAGDPGFIPAGINLGGYSMLRLQDSILFFHRMKLRNNTHFRIDSLHNDLFNMVVDAKLSLNDLHIMGAYERVTTETDPSELFYRPTFGEVEFLLRNVQYNMEGRYRLLRNKLTIELVVSEINTSDILMTYYNNENLNKPITLQRKNIDEFLDRLKTDLDKWLKDYFNDYLMYFDIEGSKANSDLLKYEKEKYIALNDYTDQVLEKMKNRLKELKSDAVQVPRFKVTAVTGMQIKLKNGVLRGLDTIHRRGVATSKREGKFRKIDMMIGFSTLQATYQYEAILNTGIPPMNGVLFVIADELVAHLGLVLTKNPQTLNIIVDSIEQIKPESITVEGPANRVIGNFKNLLQRHIFTFISNAIAHNVRMLNSITKCEPQLNAFKTEDQIFSQENESNIDSDNKNGLSHKTNQHISELTKQVNTKSDEIQNSDENTTNIDIIIDKNEDDTAVASSGDEIEDENRSSLKADEFERIKGHVVFSYSDEATVEKDTSSNSDASSGEIIENPERKPKQKKKLPKHVQKYNKKSSAFINKIPAYVDRNY